MTARAYGKFVQHLAKADIDVDSLAFGAVLLGSGYTPNFDTHQFRSDLTSEVSGTGYSTGGVALTGEVATLDTTNHWLSIDADDVDFGTLTVTGITQMVVYTVTGSSATDMLVSNHSFASQSPAGQPFKYVVHANGLVTIAY